VAKIIFSGEVKQSSKSRLNVCIICFECAQYVVTVLWSKITSQITSTLFCVMTDKSLSISANDKIFNYTVICELCKCIITYVLWC